LELNVEIVMAIAGVPFGGFTSDLMVKEAGVGKFVAGLMVRVKELVMRLGEH
jgi:hypothetical protein